MIFGMVYLGVCQIVNDLCFTVFFESRTSCYGKGNIGHPKHSIVNPEALAYAIAADLFDKSYTE
jgi:hypothetical protein